MSLRNDALQAFATIPTETVEAAGLTFEVRGLLVKDAADLYKSITVEERGETTVDRQRMWAVWTIACVHDPETGEKLFEDADRDVLMDSANLPVQKLGTAAMKLSGYGGDDADAARELKRGSV